MGKRVYLFVLIVLFQTGITFAQQIEWQNTIGGSGFDQFYTIKQTSDNGYICGGGSISNISGDKTENPIGMRDFWILKLSASGAIQWQNSIGGFQNDDVWDIQQTNDGGYICGGSSFSNISGDKTENCFGGHDYWIVKLNSVGVIQWQNTIGGNDIDYLTSIMQTADGGYICGGYSKSGLSGEKTEASKGLNDYWIVKLDGSGNIIWQNTIGGNNEDYLYSIKQTFDGGYICGGASGSNISSDKTENSHGQMDYWVIKLNSTGSIQWQKTIGGGSNDYLNSINQNSDGNYICGGMSASDIYLDKTENSIGGTDYWVLKLDSTGNILWQNTIGGQSDDELHSIQQSRDGGYLCSGFSMSPIGGDKTEGNMGSWDYWILKLDSNGIVQWQNTVGSNLVDHCVSGEQTSDDGYIAGGFSDSPIYGDKTENCIGQLDYWIVKLSGKTNLIKGTVFIDANSNGIKEPTELPVRFKNVTEINTGRIAFTDNFGNYTLSVLNSGNYQVEPTPITYYNSIPASHTANFSGILQTDSLNVFAMQPIGSINDLCISITPTTLFRSGTNASYQVNYNNQGTTTLNPTIVFYTDPGVSFISSVPAPTSIYPDSVIYNIGSMDPFQSGQITINVHVNTGLPTGTLINSGVSILPIINDFNPMCNQSYWEVHIVASLDPNDILVNRDTLFNYEISTSPELEYIIRFQNTGNDTAFYVRVDNPLPIELQPGTIEFISSSHPCSIEHQVYENTLKFTFNNIQLPDSNVNEQASHGFVRYKIKTQNTLLAGDTINNNARIIFDYNVPVATNTAMTKIIAPTGTAEISGLDVNIFPNPVKDEINIELKNINESYFSIELYNVFGQRVKVLQPGMQVNGNWKGTFDINDISEGVYLITITGERTFSKRFVKL